MKPLGLMRLTWRLAEVAICLLAFLEASLYGLSFPLFSLLLEKQGASALVTGLNATMASSGVIAIGLFVPTLVVAVGYRRCTASCFAVAALCFGGMLHLSDVTSLFAFRFVLGLVFGILWITTEAWLNHVVEDGARGRANAVFQMLYSVGFLLGPTLVYVIGAEAPAVRAIACTVAVTGIGVAVASPADRSWPEDKTSGLDWRVAWRARSLLIAAAVTGLVETALYTLLPIFAMRRGFVQHDAVGLLIAFSLGAITFAAPLGWLSDRLNRRVLLPLVALVAAAAIAALNHPALDLSAAWCFNVLAGGTLVGLYSLNLSILGQTHKGLALPVAATAFSMSYAAGCAGGTAVGGLVMEAWGSSGLPAAAALILSLYAVSVLRPTDASTMSRRGRRAWPDGSKAV